MNAHSDPDTRVGRFADYLESSDLRGALAYAVGLLDDGLAVDELVLDLLAPAQALVGLRWELGDWSVAAEHAATAITEAVLAVAGARTVGIADRGRLVLVCAESERHSLPARMITELLRAEGFSIVFLGAASTKETLASFLSQFEADALIVSCSIAMNLPSAVGMLAAAKHAAVPSLCGGRAFGASADRATLLGASGWAPDLPTAVGLLDRWRSDRPASNPSVATGAKVCGALELAHRSVVQRCVAAHTARADVGVQIGLGASESWLRDEFDAIVSSVAATILLDDASILIEFAHWLSQRLRHDPRIGTKAGSLLQTVTGVLADEYHAASAYLQVAMYIEGGGTA
jgi:methylmalonyl-CoA mutase cobalamin-binding subunit